MISTAARLSRLQGRIWSQDVWKLGQKLVPAQSLFPATTSAFVVRHFHNTPQHLRQPREYDEVFKKSVEDPEEFWGNLGEDIDWYSPYTRVMDNSSPPFTKWWVISLVIINTSFLKLKSIGLELQSEIIFQPGVRNWSIMYRSNRSVNIHPPAFEFLENQCSNIPPPLPNGHSNAPS